MIRQLRILDFALQELWRQKGRNAAVFVVHASLVFVLASVLLMASALRHEAGLVLAASPELIVQRLCAGRHSMIPLSYREPIETIRGVRAVKPRYWGYYYDPPPGTTYTLMASDEESPFAKAFSDAVQEQDDNPWTCVVGAGIAEARMLEPGDLLPVKAADGGLRALRVIGVFTAESQLMTHDLILLRASAWRSVFDIQEAVATDLAVEVANPEEADTVSRKILERLPDVRVISRQAMLRTYDALFQWRSGMVLLVLCGALVAFGILAWGQATAAGADERRHLGVLKALGWSVSDLMTLKWWEGFSPAIAAFLVGALAAHLHVVLGGCALLRPFLQGWSVLFPKFDLQPHGELLRLTTVLLLTVVPYLLVILGPAWRAAITDPEEVLRR